MAVFPLGSDNAPVLAFYQPKRKEKPLSEWSGMTICCFSLAQNDDPALNENILSGKLRAVLAVFWQNQAAHIP
jgi:hypothetical protein